MKIISKEKDRFYTKLAEAYVRLFQWGWLEFPFMEPFFEWVLSGKGPIEKAREEVWQKFNVFVEGKDEKITALESENMLLKTKLDAALRTIALRQNV